MAGRKKLAPQVCSLLVVIKGKVARKGATSEEIVAALRRDHPEAIKAETADILHIGLIQLANQTCRLRSGGATSAQLEMFAEYGVPKMITLRIEDSKGRVRKVHKALGALTLAEARQHVSEHTKPRPRASEEVKELARLVDDVQGFGETELSTIDECWAKKRA
jgi:hypothetical protein